MSKSVTVNLYIMYH